MKTTFFEPDSKQKVCPVCGVVTKRKSGYCSKRCEVIDRETKWTRRNQDGRKTLRVPTEHEEQVMLFEWWNMTPWARKEGLVMAAIPNGGLRNVITAKRLKAEGVIAGMPDILLSEARGGYHGLYIEMKRTKGGRLSDSQAGLHQQLREAGYAVEICKGFEAAKAVIEKYLSRAKFGDVLANMNTTGMDFS